MFQDALGIPVFTEGLTQYLKKMKGKPAQPSDLFEELQKAFGNSTDVINFMKSWETQSGYPVITINKTENQIEISQERFLYQKSKQENFPLWIIPLNYVVASDPKFNSTLPDYWMHTASKVTIRIENAPKRWQKDDWIIFNVQSTGFYRVNYDDELWKLIVKELTEGDYKKIHVANRAKLVDDSLNLARAGKLNYRVVFDVLSYMQNETDYLVWGLAEKELNFLDRVISGSAKTHEHFLNFMGKLINETYTKYGMEIKESHTNFDRYSQETGINWACRSGNKDCLDRTLQKLLDNIQNGTKIHPDLQPSIYCNSLRKANDTVLNLILKRLEKSEYQGERTLLAASLACSQNPNFLNQFLKEVLTDNFRIQERRTILVSVIENGNANVGLGVGLAFIEANAAEINKL